MSDINLDFVVDNSNVNVTVESNDITFTPTPINLTVTSGALAIPGGSVGSLQYNANGALGGIPTVSYTSGNLLLGNIANVQITGGTNGYVLQTDGTGNLSWTAQTGGGGGNGVPGGSNTQIQYNDSGLFGGNAGFTFNEVNGNVNIPGNLIVAQSLSGNGSGLSAIAGANVTGTVANATYAVSAGSASTAVNVTANAQPNITSLGSLTGLEIVGPLNVSSNTVYANVLSANTANVTGNVTANYFNGNLVGGAITGTLANVNGTATLGGLEVVGNTTLTGTGFVQQMQEKVTVVGTAPGANYTYDLLDQVVVYNTASANANVTVNFRGNSTTTANTFISNSKSVTATYLLTNGATAYAVSNVQIDGSNQTIRWAGNTTPNVFTNTIMSYTFNLIKTGSSTYTVLGSATRFG